MGPALSKVVKAMSKEDAHATGSDMDLFMKELNSGKKESVELAQLEHVLEEVNEKILFELSRCRKHWCRKEEKEPEEKTGMNQSAQS